MSARQPWPWPHSVRDADELSALLQPPNWHLDPSGEPLLMAGLVALAAADPPGLATALADLKLPPPTSPHQRITPTVAWWEAIRELAGLRPTERRAQLRQALAAVRRGERPRVRSWIELPETVAAMRVTEIAVGLQSDPVPALVSTPTDPSGSLQPEALLARVSAAEHEGWQPWQLDLDQALLRLPRQVDPEIVSRAQALRSPAGLRLARWLAAGPLPDPTAKVIGEPAAERPANRRRDAQRTAGDARRLRPRPQGRRRVALELAVHHRSSLHRLLFRLDPFSPPGVARRGLGAVPTVPPDMLPHHREVIAAWMLTDLNQVLHGRGAIVLPSGSDRGGPAGPALTLLLAYTLGASDRTARRAGLDALLSLSAAGNLNGRSLGEQLGALVADRVLELHRLVPALTGASQAGALAGTWDIIAALLPEVLARLIVPPTGLPSLLTLAADLAATLGRRDFIPGLTQLACRRDASRTVREAQRLQTTLTGQPPKHKPAQTRPP